MAETIKLSPELMENRANKYQDAGIKVEEVIATMVQLMSYLSEEWEGSAKEAFLAKWEELKPSFDSAKEMIFQIAERLRITAQNTRETDAANASSWK